MNTLEWIILVTAYAAALAGAAIVWECRRLGHVD